MTTTTFSAAADNWGGRGHSWARSSHPARNWVTAYLAVFASLAATCAFAVV